MRATAIWWLCCCLEAVGLGAAGYFGLYGKLLEVDPTFISWLIIALMCGVTGWIGWLTYQRERYFRNVDEPAETCVFISQLCVTLGLIGTIIGMMLIIDASLGSLGSTALADMPKAISKLGVGIGTKLVTSLCGLIACACLQVQLRNLEVA